MRAPNQPVGQTLAAGEVKTPLRIKEEKQQEDGGRDRGVGEKKKGNKYIFMFAGMSASPSIPPADVIGKVRRRESGTHPGQGEDGG